MLLKRLQQTLIPYQNANRWWLAYSGGSDSTALLSAIAQIHSSNYPPVTVVHVHHGLSEHADQWMQFAEQTAKSYGFSFIGFHARLTSGANIEQSARDARYAIFEQLVGANDVLLMAHHQDDQAETLLYRLMRGTGVKGMAGMSTARPIGDGTLLRPLIDVAKSEINQWLEQKAQAFIEDDSNSNQRFDRNYLRHSVLPVLDKRWSGAKQAIGRFSERAADAQLLLEELAQEDLERCKGVYTSRFCEWQGGALLSLAELAKLSPARQKNLLHFYLSELGINASSKHIDTLISQFSNVSYGQRPNFILGEFTLYRHGDCLFVLKSGFDGESLLSEIVDQLVAVGKSTRSCEGFATKGQGLLVAHQYYFAPVKQSERFKPAWRQHSTTLKKLYQELGIPAWQRKYLFGVWSDGQLAAVPGVGVAERFSARNDAESLAIKLQMQQFVYLCQ